MEKAPTASCALGCAALLYGAFDGSKCAPRACPEQKWLSATLTGNCRTQPGLFQIGLNLMQRFCPRVFRLHIGR
ncbi:hypothetical protein EAK41_17735 [Salmonella enterica]|uniref:Uncharacterized protein n=2 Tax=Salmonella enterica TaxID=28901 RepID=A0A607KKP6_SALER|nr:hypothetical protein [Salmonella enterica subsp. enterica]EAB1951014.1 hypothetical protein [Salmonella enterica]EBD0183437.1 hypothetical protein [Salmonella enterica subsp. enterica serovar Schwarzengrund]EBH8876274.1 hypothetical protein [Salmonella enterica subsp. houtenae serovar 53:z4,z23:-]EBI0168075.1 hypothetical protein [Salmonella enterica subsp. enterica serovar 4,5,12:b:-]ECS6439820.1 hypothetical protein [Salmonella enterica subsp. enterica serovar 4,[5],12:b:-]ECT9355814.1 h